MFRVIDANGRVWWTGDNPYLADARVTDTADREQITCHLERWAPLDPHANDGWLHDRTVHPIPGGV